MNVKGVVVGVGIAAAVVGIMLGNLLPDLSKLLGGGGGDGQGETRPEGGPQPPSQPASQPPVKPPVKPVERGAVVVRIQDDRFLVKEPGGSFADTTLEALVERVKATPPNSQGIRVCIRREPSAKAGAWNTLKEHLYENGVTRTQVDWDNDQVQ